MKRDMQGGVVDEIGVVFGGIITSTIKMQMLVIMGKYEIKGGKIRLRALLPSLLISRGSLSTFSPYLPQSPC